jgi:hypothetical protein
MLARMPSFPRPKPSRARALALACCALASAASASSAGDPLASEIERWTAFAKTHPATDEVWKQIKDGSETVLGRAAEALRAGRRLLALQRLAWAREQMLAATYMAERSAAQRRENADFEAEWRRMGTVLRADLVQPAADTLADVRPAAVRALAEAALPQVGVYYEASLEYGRNTMPDSGFYYLGAAQAQRDFIAFARSLGEGASGTPLALRALGPELELLETEMLAAYRPPLSIEEHPQFIGASSMLKEARELDTAGLRHGALLRYLQAAARFAPLRAAPPAMEAAALAAELGRLASRLAAGGVDHSVGRLFLETAQAEAATESGAANAAAIVRDVLPRYFAALEPAAPPPPRAPARATVTLVRWPYT